MTILTNLDVFRRLQGPTLLLVFSIGAIGFTWVAVLVVTVGSGHAGVRWIQLSVPILIAIVAMACYLSHGSITYGPGMILQPRPYEPTLTMRGTDELHLLLYDLPAYLLVLLFVRSKTDR